MGKLADANLRLRCVHCHSTETPLWRAGPDGPKTLCNACGVRYKKGKLVLYKDDEGNLTAIKRENAVPVHVPPVSKKASKKAHSQSASQQPTSSNEVLSKKSTVRKVPSEGSIAPVVGKKPRSRSRRANAGQLPGRYASKTLPDSMLHWRSPTSSPQSSPSSPVESPRCDGMLSSSPSRLSHPQFAVQFVPFQENVVTDCYHFSCFAPHQLSVQPHVADMRSGFLSRPGPFTMDEPPSMYHFPGSDDESLFPNMACLGLDCSAEPDNTTLLPMPADPSSVEQFSFAFSGLGRENCLEMDNPDRVEALRGMVLDRTRMVSRAYEATIQALSRLCEQRYSHSRSSQHGRKLSTLEDCKSFVRAFAHEQTAGFSLDELGDLRGGLAAGLGFGEKTSGVMLSEKTAHSLAVESFKTLMDSSELAGFAEACMVELIAEDVVAALRQQGMAGSDTGSGCRPADSTMGTKAIPTTA